MRLRRASRRRGSASPGGKHRRCRRRVRPFDTERGGAPSRRRGARRCVRGTSRDVQEESSHLENLTRHPRAGGVSDSAGGTSHLLTPQSLYRGPGTLEQSTWSRIAAGRRRTFFLGTFQKIGNPGSATLSRDDDERGESALRRSLLSVFSARGIRVKHPARSSRVAPRAIAAPDLDLAHRSRVD